MALIIGNAAVIFSFVIGISLPIVLASFISVVLKYTFISFSPDFGLLIEIFVLLNLSIIIGSIKPIYELSKYELSIQRFVQN